MRTVVTVSLNGNAYQMDEGAYEALRAYLDEAQAKLRDDPGCAEIIADLEQAVADKCNHCLNDHKNVVSTEELQRILTEMGPVDSGAEPGADQAGGAAGTGRAHTGSGARADPAAPKRLYQIREGALISGLCKGIAAYLDIDVAIVRIVFVLLAIVTWGGWILVYVALMFAIPFASTSEEQAAAHGLPFTAQLLVEQAKKHYESFRQGAGWRHNSHREARRQRRQWRAAWRHRRADMRARRHWYWRPPPPPHSGDTDYAAQLLAGVLNPLAALANVVLLIALLIAIAQLIAHGVVFGWTPPPSVPLWAGILILVVIYHIVATPLRLMRHAAYYGPGPNLWIALWGSIVWLAFMAVFFWFAYQYWPELQHFLRQLTDSLHLRLAHPAGQAISWIVTTSRD
ncbi:MAG TPA: PspC domain-containing protein [Steroidobacteraceae bacterium]|jgi:phage shock protein PspC (stress-responsive transcriptional regulator)|nr:PspC domain-containing protein [Steroidobacteraceae bacterium]